MRLGPVGWALLLAGLAGLYFLSGRIDPQVGVLVGSTVVGAGLLADGISLRRRSRPRRARWTLLAGVLFLAVVGTYLAMLRMSPLPTAVQTAIWSLAILALGVSMIVDWRERKRAASSGGG